jgi:hypothetical protein
VSTFEGRGPRRGAEFGIIRRVEVRDEDVLFTVNLPDAAPDFVRFLSSQPDPVSLGNVKWSMHDG